MQAFFYEHSVKKIREEAWLAGPVLNKNAEAYTALRGAAAGCPGWLPPHKHTYLPTKKPAAPQILLQPPQALSFSFSFNPLQFFLYKADNTFRPLLRALRGFLSR